MEVKMTSAADVPWQELAFPVNHWALRDYLSLNGQPPAQPFSTTAERLTERMPPVDCHPDYTLP